MRKILLAGLLSGLVFTLFGCSGGGSGSSNPTVSGTASQGSAFPNGSPVTLRDANGNVSSSTVQNNGVFSVSVSGLTAPYFLNASSAGGKYYSYATNAGTTNINPLTNLCVLVALNSSTVTNSTTLPSDFSTQFSNAVSQLKNSLSLQYSSSVPATQQDFLNGNITLGAGVDALLGSLTINLPNNIGAFTALIGSQPIFSGTISGGTVNVTPMFTTAMVSGKTFGVNNVGTSYGLAYYNPNGTINYTDSTYGPNSGTWSINSAGQLILTWTTGTLAGEVDTKTITGITNSTITDNISITIPGSQPTTGTQVMIPLMSIAVMPANPSLPAGETQQFTATGTFADGSTQDLTALVSWSSSNTSYATIASGGLATGVAAGATTITATSGTITETAMLTVSAQNPASLAVGVWAMDPSQTIWPNESTTGWTEWLTIQNDGTYSDVLFDNGVLNDYQFGTWQLSENNFTGTPIISTNASKVGVATSLTFTFSNNNNTVTLSGFPNKPTEVGVYNRGGNIPFTTAMLSGNTYSYSFVGGSSGTITFNADGTTSSSLTWSVNASGQLVVVGASGIPGAVATITAIGTSGSTLNTIYILNDSNNTSNDAVKVMTFTQN